MFELLKDVEEWGLHLVFIVITVVLIIGVIFFSSPFFFAYLDRIYDWWINYYWIPCLPCGVVL